jgi:hypothetical protein
MVNLGWPVLPGQLESAPKVESESTKGSNSSVSSAGNEGLHQKKGLHSGQAAALGRMPELLAKPIQRF